ncbi:MAG: sigma-54-dependent Fis family transcriptional regulator [Deltaproteobacteria bacterium]|nr:sigma-54-dependent Fis family transcriptional regulator [Deltaproteobacteria bacterium]
MDRSAHVLVVDDDSAIRVTLGALLRQAGYEVTEVSSGAAALDATQRSAVDSVITDLRMPGMDGMQLLSQLVARSPDLPVIVLTAHGSIPLAVEAIRAGAADFLSKPFERDELLRTVERSLLKARSEPPAGPEFAAPVMKEVAELIRRAARGHSTVLIRGESGVGKDRVAREIHELSPRRDAPFVKIHCSALPDSLLESELFGYEKGAFTGASVSKPGRIELAEGGTLFLDEIGDVTAAFQVKLLRVLQDREVDRLGSNRPRRVDVRIVAATHRDLESMVSEGAFREDLLYRLNVIPLVIPPLRERRDEIRALSTHFCRELARANGLPRETIDEEAVQVLLGLPWPGNVRQLQNFVERLVVLSDGPVVTLGDVERELDRQGVRPVERVSGSLVDARLRAERDSLVEALQRAGNNRSLAARILGVSRRTLYNKLKEHAIE